VWQREQLPVNVRVRPRRKAGLEIDRCEVTVLIEKRPNLLLVLGRGDRASRIYERSSGGERKSRC
jgi:hypothetical protein